ncbi:LysR family transcriptional regulator [Plastoroseomonas hellenica]|uniref:LysR family transcriptional regulator n=1 Tax=Plastoroseomonas hellenica TaxID=2687306 RepID=UPI001BAD2A4C|nr:LysR family transcriptional regulator [Plastoroseomonas hellenica]
MTPDLLLVEAVLAVVDTGSFRAAAEALGRSQPTVSQQVARLEAELGVTLLLRRRDRCVPTPDGALFLPGARRALEAARQAVAAVRGRPLAIGAASNPGIYLLPARLARAAMPTVLRLGSNPETVARLLAGEVDIAFLEWWEDRPGYEVVRWREEEMVVIVPPGHHWAGLPCLPAAALAEEPMIGGEPGTGTGRLLAGLLGAAAGSLRVARQLGSTDAVKRAVAAGLGISVVMRAAVGDEVAAGSLVAVPLETPGLRRMLLAVLPAEAPQRSPARLFLDAAA